VRTFLHFISDAACAVLNVASIAIAAGTVAAIYTHRLRDGVLVALGTLVFAGAGFGYSIWRTYRPRRRSQMFRSRRPSWVAFSARGSRMPELSRGLAR
jgi:hypothetical protein